MTSVKRVAEIAAVVMGTLLVVVLLYEFRHAVILFLFSLAVAAASRPAVEHWERRGVKRALAIILVFVLAGAFIALIFLLVGNFLLNDLRMLTDNLARTYDQIWQEWPNGTTLERLIIQQLPAPADLYESFSPDQQNTALPAFLGFTMSSFTLTSDLIAILFLSIYWAIDRVHFERLWLSLLPVESRARYRDIWRNIERDFGAYVRSEVLQSLFALILLGVGFTLMGLPYPILLALFGALAWLIPWLGGVLAVLPVALTGFTSSVGLGIFAAVFTIGVLFFLEFYIEPRFIRTRQYSSILNILLILILAEPYGVMGLIVAPPLAAAIELIFRYSLANRNVPLPIESVQRIAELRARIIYVRKMIARDKEEAEPQTLSMLSRLESLVDKADSVMEEQKLPQSSTSS